MRKNGLRQVVKIVFLNTLPCFFLAGCGTAFKKEDCQMPPDKIGQCFADAGYSDETVSIYEKHCKKDHGISPDVQQIQLKRANRFKALCKGRKSTFMVAFRSNIDPFHPFKCSGENTELPNWNFINQDAMEISENLKAFRVIKWDLRDAREKRNQSWFDGLLDWVNGTSRNTENKLVAIDKDINQLLKKYEKDNIYRGDLESLFSLSPDDRFFQNTSLRNRMTCLPSERL